jgi:hypothetical protein
MRKLLFFVALLFGVSSCAPNVSVVPTGASGPSKPSGCSIDIYYPHQTIPRACDDIGHVSLDDTGFTMICDESTMLRLAQDKACASGGDAIHLVKIKPPDWTSTCYRIEARILKYRDSKTASQTIPLQPSTTVSSKDDAVASQESKAVSGTSGKADGRPSSTTPIQGVNWAVVIGVSNYEDTRIAPLRYASRDSLTFYEWLVSPTGGKYAPQNVKLLINQDASFNGIRNALFVWLKQALKEDTVIIYFAGHGSPESPDSPNNLFLLPYNAHYDNIATTGFPMWDIETALKRFIKARKIVVIADACHAGGIGQSFDMARRADRAVKVNRISEGLQHLTKVGDGVCVISASDSEQFSQEGQQWGGGHGVFTYFLLKGLKGSADYNKDNNISLGELIPYLSEQVRRETKSAQSPTVSGKFDPALTIGR